MIRRLSALLLAMWFVPGCGATDVSGQFMSPGDGTYVFGTVRIRVSFTGPTSKVELVVADAVVDSVDIAAEDEVARLEWDTTSVTDGEATLLARVHSQNGGAYETDPMTLNVDNTPPEVAATIEELSIVTDDVVIPLTVTEANLQALRLTDQDGVLIEVTESAESLTWDTSAADDGVHWLQVEVVDMAGTSTTTDAVPVIVAYNGTEETVEYIPAATVNIPPNYAEVEYHVRGKVTGRTGIKRVVSWLTWNPEADWRIEYAIGQGYCPHRGVQYLAEESRDGVIVLDLLRSELSASTEARLPAADRNSDTFPYNGDPATFGAFFGHVAPLDPADHINEKLPIEMRFILYE